MLPRIVNRLAARELPKIFMELAKLLCLPPNRPARSAQCQDLSTVSHNAGIGQQFLQLGITIASDLCRVEIVECVAIRLALFQDR